MQRLIKVLEDNHIDYFIYKKRCKNLTIKYDDKHILRIVQPILMPDEKADYFISEHLPWILKHYPKSSIPHEEYHNGDEYLFLGKTYTLEIHENKHESVELFDQKIITYVKSLERTEKVLDDFRFEKAELLFNELFFNCFTEMNLKNTYPKLVIKKAKSRWGCCYLKKNTVMLNIALIHCNIDLIKYVIYHELVHFLYPNHSPMFHAELEKWCPNEKTYRKKLKNYSPSYK